MIQAGFGLPVSRTLADRLLWPGATERSGAHADKAEYRAERHIAPLRLHALQCTH